MSDLSLLAGMRIRQTYNNLCRVALGRAGRSFLKIFVVSIFAFGFWQGLFLLFRNGFQFLDTMPDLKAMIIGLLFGIFFAALTLMLTFSNGIIYYTSFFRSKETDFLFSSPLQPASVFSYKLFEGLVFSSWAFFFIGLPLLFAHGLSEQVPAYFYPVSLLFFAAFVFIPASVGSVIALVIGAYFSKHPKRIAVALGVMAAAVGAAWLLRSYSAFHLRGRAYEVWMMDIVGRFSWSENPLLPSHWIAQGILKTGAGEYREAAFYFLLILSNSMVALLFCHWLAGRIYMRGYQMFHGGGSRKRKNNSSANLVKFFDSTLMLLLGWLPRRMRWMVLKDIKSFRRDPVQWSQALIFFGLIFVYIINLRLLNYHIRQIGFKNMVAFLNLTATSLTLATFTSRFVFPLLSLEGQRFWILGLAPIQRREILMGKFAFAFIGCFAISAVLMTGSNLMLAVPPEIMLLHLYAVLIISAGLSGLSVGLGALYIDLQQDNPSKIVSGFGGTLNLVLSMLFVAIVVVGLAIPIHMHLVRGIIGTEVFIRWLAASLSLITIAGISASIIPLVMGRRALRRLET